MRNLVVIAVMAIFVVTPALAMYTEDFETKPFGKTGNWSCSGDVIWKGSKRSDDFVRLGQARNDKDNLLWRSFTAPTTGEYSVSFDYRFIGKDINPDIDDTFSVQIGAGKDSLYDVFEAASSTGLTGGQSRPGNWQTSTDSLQTVQTVKLDAGQTYYLQFDLNEAKGRLAPVTLLQIDNICIEEIPSGTILGDSASGEILFPDRMSPITGAGSLTDNLISNNNTAEDFGSYSFSDGSGAPVVPAPGAFLLVAIGMASLSGFRKRMSILN